MAERPGPWDLLGHDRDPVIADVAAIDERAAYFRSLAESIRTQGDRLARIASGESLKGAYADELRGSAKEVSRDLKKVVGRYEAVVQALTQFRPAVDAALTGSSAALDDAIDAQGAAGSAEARPEAVPTPDAELTPEQQQANADRTAAVDAAAGRLAAAKSKLTTVLTEFDEAGRNTARVIRGGFNDGLKDSWIDRFIAGFKKFLKILVEVLTYIGMALAVLAIIIPGVGPLILAGAVIGAVATIAEIALIAMGEGSLLDLGLAIAGVLTAGAAKLLGPAVKSGFRGAMGSFGKGAGSRPDVPSSGSRGAGDPRIANNNANPLEHITAIIDRIDCGDPIDVATGAVMLDQEDVSLPGTLPLVISRTHLSTYRAGRLFGPTWSSTLDERIEVEDDALHLALADGTLLRYPVPRGVESVLPEIGPYLALRRVRNGFIVGDPQSDRIRYFAGVRGDDTLPLRAVIDGAGNHLHVRYRDGMPVSVEHSGGYRVEIESVDGLVTALRLADAPTPLAEYHYDSASRLVELIDAVGTPQRFSYDGDGRMTGWEDVNGRSYHYGYDGAGRCVRADGTDGYLATQLAFDTENRVTTVTDSLGAVTRYRLDENLRVIGQTDPLGHSTSAERDRFGRVTAETDEFGNVTRWEYDAIGNPEVVTRPDGGRLVIEYDDGHRPVTVTRPDGAMWRYEYDEGGRLVRTVDPMGAAVSYTYDAVSGAVNSVTDALGGVTRIWPNAAGLPLLVSDPDGAEWRYEYDELGNTTTVVDPLGNVASAVSDAAGNLLLSRSANGAVERIEAKARGSFEEQTDARGGVRRIDYGPFDVPVGEQGPDGGRLSYCYDTELRRVSITNERGLEWRYEYDAAGRKVAEIDYNGRVLRYDYDAAGRLVHRTNGAGQSITIERDAVGRVVRRTSGDETAVFTYDATDRMVSASNGHSEVRFSYDARGRLLSESIDGRIVSSEFDAVGRRITRRTPSGQESVLGYDAAGRPTTLTTAGRTLRFGYDAAGRETVRALLGADGTGTDPIAELRQDWTATGQLAAQTVRRGSDTLQRREYGYLLDGNLGSVDDLISGNRTYDVDPNGRVRSVRGPDWREEYDYDATGAVRGAEWPGAAAVAGPREYAGTLLTTAGSTTYTHDEDGRIATRERGGDVWTYRWSAENRLVGVRTPDGVEWRYRYDPFGRRIAKERLDPATGEIVEKVEFAWDGQLPAEQVHSGIGRPSVATVWEYAPDSDIPLTQIERVVDSPVDAPAHDASRRDDRFHAIVSDLVGAPAELVADTGALAGHLHTALWGPTISSDGTASTPLRFPGQYYDEETGLHYNRHRYYDPETGRYLSHDPLGLTPAPDSLAYVDNPTAMIDPLGLAPQRTTPCVVGGGARFNPYQRGNAGPSTSKRKYPQSTYGDRDAERARLNKRFDFTIDGRRTHQSEHAAGFDILTDNGAPKGLRKDSAPLENNAYAYYEDFANHRYHPGTGKGKAAHESGFTKGDVRDAPDTRVDDSLGYEDRLGSYRFAQRQALEGNDPSTAVQLNQLGYGHQQGFQNSETIKAGYDKPHSFSDKVYHGDDVNHVHNPDHPLYDKDTADAARAEQARRDEIKVDPNHAGRAANDTEQTRMDIADDSYHKMIDDMRQSGEGIRYNPKSGAPVPVGGHQVDGTGHVTTRPIDKWDAAEMHGARDAARTGEWPGYGGFYRNPTPDDWAKLDRGDFDEPPRPPGTTRPGDRPSYNAEPTAEDWAKLERGDFDPPQLRDLAKLSPGDLDAAVAATRNAAGNRNTGGNRNAADAMDVDP